MTAGVDEAFVVPMAVPNGRYSRGGHIERRDVLSVNRIVLKFYPWPSIRFLEHRDPCPATGENMNTQNELQGCQYPAHQIVKEDSLRIENVGYDVDQFDKRLGHLLDPDEAKKLQIHKNVEEYIIIGQILHRRLVRWEPKNHLVEHDWCRVEEVYREVSSQVVHHQHLDVSF